jgi:hypothetical protein
MRTRADLHDYQKTAAKFLRDRPGAALWLDMGLGKLQPNSEPVLTPSGWRPMGDLRPGDYVIGSNGRQTKVMSIHPQGTQKVVRVTMTDGSSCRVGWEHLWYVKDHNAYHRGKRGQVLTTWELVEKGLYYKNGDNKPMPRWFIPLVEPVQYPSISLPMPPYTLGVLLGDGSLLKNGSVKFHTDAWIIEQCGHKAKLRPSETCDYYAESGCIRDYSEFMLKSGLAGTHSHDKFIPEEFLRASPEQRLALLQGLLDTDGTVHKAGGGAGFSSSSKALAEGVIELAQSLGGIARLHHNPTGKTYTYKGEKRRGRPGWGVGVSLPPHLVPFRLPRKRDVWEPVTKYLPIRKIERVEVIGDEESTCIRVAAEDHLYVTKDHIVTHNTIATLTALTDALLLGQADAAILVAPIRVIETVWRQEAANWEHTKHLKFSLVHGTPAQRFDALRKKADVYLINFENLQWLLLASRKMRGFPEGRLALIIDESSKMKAPRTKRFKALKRMLPRFCIRWELTGTPAPNSYLNIWSQIFLLDGGQRFGDRYDLYREEFFRKADYQGYRYDIRAGAQRRIERAIAPIVLRLDARDCKKELPPVVRNEIWLDMPPALLRQYKRLEDEMFLELESQNIEVFNAAALTAKLWQFANGAVYDTEKNWHAVHDLKLEALDDILEEAGGQPVLIAYWFKSDLARLRAHYGNDIVVFSESKNPNAVIDQWVAGKLDKLFIHPASGGHGIDRLQLAGHILAFFSQTWSLEMHDQLVARLNRQGQMYPTIVHYPKVRHTVDEAISDAIATNARGQAQLLNALRAYRRREQLI